MNIKQVAVITVCLLGAHQLYKHFAGDRAELTLRNLSSVNIREVSVDVGGEPQEFYNISPGQSVEGNFRVVADSSYRIACIFADGTRLTQEVGYLMKGRGVKDTVSLQRDGMLLEAGEQ